MEQKGSMRLHRAGRVEDDTSKILWSSGFGVWAQTTNCKRNLWEVKRKKPSKFIWEQIFPNAKTSCVGYGLGGGEIARSSLWAQWPALTLRAGVSSLDVPTTEAMG